MSEELDEATVGGYAIEGAQPENGELEGFSDSAEEPSSVVVITGMSGAGKTEAMHTFEDMGYFCIDNLPPALIVNLVSLAELRSGSMRRLCVACDLRTKEFFPELKNELAHLSDAGISHTLLFLDASDRALISRYKAVRRRHPLSSRGVGLADAIKKEREALSGVRESADHVIDTSRIKPATLRQRIKEIIANGGSSILDLTVEVYSFGFKHGAPTDADVMIDVRFLPNPFYIDELRSKTGLDEDVKNYVLGAKETQKFLNAWFALLDVLMPGYIKEGKPSLSIAVGCTGGQHRSVVLAAATGNYLLEKGYQVTTTHRDLPLAEVSA